MFGKKTIIFFLCAIFSFNGLFSFVGNAGSRLAEVLESKDPIRSLFTAASLPIVLVEKQTQSDNDKSTSKDQADQKNNPACLYERASVKSGLLSSTITNYSNSNQAAKVYNYMYVSDGLVSGRDGPPGFLFLIVLLGYLALVFRISLPNVAVFVRRSFLNRRFPRRFFYLVMT